MKTNSDIMDNKKTFKIELSDGTKCIGKFKDENDARDIYDIFYGMEIIKIQEIKEN